MSKFEAKGPYGSGKAVRRSRPVASRGPDTFDVDAHDIAFVEGLSDSEIRARLIERDVHPNVADDLVRDRETNGGRWRIVQELCR